MKELMKVDEIVSVARGVGSPARVEILRYLHEQDSSKTLTEISNHFKDKWVFMTLQNHCRILAEEKLIKMERIEGRFEITLLISPHIFIEEIN